MRYLSVCSGIEAATAAWHPLGWSPFAFAEIEPFPSIVLSHHYGSNLPGEKWSHNAPPNLGNITKFGDWPDANVDVLVGGTPCQSFSVAGLRKGLADPRGNLCLTFLGIADKYRPQWVLWENVPGVLSSNGGRDFGAFLGGLGQLGYGWAYRVLDAQYVRVDGFARAVPQRRRRVFVVGYLGDWRRAAAVLFERESLQGHPAPRRQAGQAVAPTISSRPTGGGGLGTDFDCDDGLIASTGDIAHCLNAGGMGRQDYETETVIAHALRAEGFDASEDGTGRGIPIIPFDTTQITSKANRSTPASGDPCHPLAKGAHAPAIAFSCKDHGADAVDDIAPTLRAMQFDKSHANAGGQLAVAIQERAVCENPDAGPDGVGVRSDGTAFTLEARTVPQAVQSGWAVRRLIPLECERLQGFEDNYTLVPVRGKPAADGPRYKALGNSMAVNVMRWLGYRIEMVNALSAMAA